MATPRPYAEPSRVGCSGGCQGNHLSTQLRELPPVGNSAAGRRDLPTVVGCPSDPPRSAPAPPSSSSTPCVPRCPRRRTTCSPASSSPVSRGRSGCSTTGSTRWPTPCARSARRRPPSPPRSPGMPWRPGAGHAFARPVGRAGPVGAARRGGRPVSVVPGDPASLSACAAVARSVAEQLGGRATGVRTASGLLGEGWTGRTSAATRRRAADLADATDACARAARHPGPGAAGPRHRPRRPRGTGPVGRGARPCGRPRRARREGRGRLGGHRHRRRAARTSPGTRRARSCRPSSTSCSPSTGAGATGSSGCCATRRVRCPIFRTGCAA